MTFDESLHNRSTSGEFAEKTHTSPDLALSARPLHAEVFVADDNGALTQEFVDTRALFDERSVDELEELESTGRLRGVIEQSVRAQRGFSDDRDVEAFIPDDLEVYFDERRSAGMHESPSERAERAKFEPKLTSPEEREAARAREQANRAFAAELERREAAQPAPRVEVRRRWFESKEKAESARTIKQLGVSTAHRATLAAQMMEEGWGAA